MKVITGLIFIFAITMALSITLTMRNFNDGQEQRPLKSLETETALHEKELMPSKRLSRFLAEDYKPKNPRAADHCKKDNEICYQLERKNSTCCNNKCIDLAYDSHNCGACKKKCLVTETCCRGKCVSLSYDKRHCGACNHKCMPGGFCIYGICDYA